MYRYCLNYSQAMVYYKNYFLNPPQTESFYEYSKFSEARKNLVTKSYRF